MSTSRFLPPVSARRAIASALDLAIRRDPLHSLGVPLLLRAPWIVAVGMLTPSDAGEAPRRFLLVASVALVGDYLSLMITSAMLRFRALSVHEAPVDSAPAPAIDCYAKGLARVPWLIVTEVVRYGAAIFGLFFFVVPGIYLGFRLALAAEAVTLHEPHLSAAFERSFALTAKRFERWVELSIACALPVIAVWFVLAVRAALGPDVPPLWFTAAWLLLAAWTPVVIYAWTFFYLRLRDASSPGVEVGPLYAAAAAAPMPPAPGMGEPPGEVVPPVTAGEAPSVALLDDPTSRSG